MSTLSTRLLQAQVAVLATMAFTLTAAGQTTTPPATKKPSVATPQMIDEAIQRSQARSVKERDQRVPERFGSEEPFTYVPGKTN